jgi:hypothetical protein
MGEVRTSVMGELTTTILPPIHHVVHEGCLLLRARLLKYKLVQAQPIADWLRAGREEKCSTDDERLSEWI